MINRIGVTAPSQVNLRVRVAEVSREVDKQLGINWEAIGTIGGLSIGLATNNPFSANVTQHVLNLGASPGGHWDLNAVIDALEDEGLVKVMAEPNLTALSGETASFLAGGEFPILVPEDDRIVIEFKKFGVSLAFTPTLLGDGQVNLHVRPEVSQLSNTNSVTLGNFEVPSLVTRRAETTVELGSGQSFAIAGLLQNNMSHDISKFPGLGDIPVLGPLFPLRPLPAGGERAGHHRHPPISSVRRPGPPACRHPPMACFRRPTSSATRTAALTAAPRNQAPNGRLPPMARP